VIGRAINKTIGFRVSHEAETAGVDLSEHAESAYAFNEVGAGFNPLRAVFGHIPAGGHSADGQAVEGSDREVSGTQGPDRQAKEDTFA
jgi:Amt family ammonium transporter